MHETQRVYGDKLTDEKDIESFLKLQLDILKKNIEEIDEGTILEKPNIYCHFAGLYLPKFNILIKHIEIYLKEVTYSNFSKLYIYIYIYM